MKSSLEDYANDKLREAGIFFEYEPYSIELLPAFQHTFDSWERRYKKFRVILDKVLNMVYTPDFIGKNWIMETKGRKTPEFGLRWKLFKYQLRNSKGVTIYMPRTFKDIDAAIEDIKQKDVRKDKRVLFKPKGVQLVVKHAKKPKVAKAKKRKSRNGG